MAEARTVINVSGTRFELEASTMARLVALTSKSLGLSQALQQYLPRSAPAPSHPPATAPFTASPPASPPPNVSLPVVNMGGNAGASAPRVELFFQRSPACFEAVLMYLVHGSLHIPPTVCPNVFQAEAEFWGVDVLGLESCCLHGFVSFQQDQTDLAKFGNSIAPQMDVLPDKATSGWGAFRQKVWAVLDGRSPTWTTKVYISVVAIAVLLSLVVMVLATHPLFQRKLETSEWKDVLGDEFTNEYESLKTQGLLPGYEDSAEVVVDDGNLDYSDVDTFTSPSEAQSTTASATSKTTSSNFRHLRAPMNFLSYTEYALMAFFTLDLGLRLLFAPRRLRFLVAVPTVADIVALLSSYVLELVNALLPSERFSQSASDVLGCLLVLRIVRFLRILKDVTGFKALFLAIRTGLRELIFIIIFLLVGVFTFGSLCYFVDSKTSIATIPDGLWWALITMTTVGYGDITPTTIWGKLVASVCAVSGILLIAISVPVFVNNFLLFYGYCRVLEVQQQRKTETLEENSPGTCLPLMTRVPLFHDHPPAYVTKVKGHPVTESEDEGVKVEDM